MEDKNYDDSEINLLERDTLEELQRVQCQNDVMLFRLEQLESKAHKKENDKLMKEMKLKKKFVFLMQMF